VYLWHRTAQIRWLKAREELLQAHAHGQLVIVRRPGRKRLELELVCRSRRDSSTLLSEFGGRIEALRRNWLERFARGDAKRIKIGKRLVVVRSINELQRCGIRCSPRSSRLRTRPVRLRTAHPTVQTIKPTILVIPASLAFGTGDHATTAMSLRFLEQLTRRWKHGWSLVDVGTGSGILALAAKCFGARLVTGVDNDPTAILTAKSNARLNKIRGATFQLGDVRKWNSALEAEVITANLYSDLLIEILPKLGGNGWLIFSGILRSQKDELLRALQRNHLNVIEMRRRGKWMAFLARRIGVLCPPNPKLANFCGDGRPPLQ
jgi:ribosomal protein L11 methyltransferase